MMSFARSRSTAQRAVRAMQRRAAATGSRPFAVRFATTDLSDVRVGSVAPMDGNTAASHVAYGLSETAFIYPISPATSMGEHVDNWASQGNESFWLL